MPNVVRIGDFTIGHGCFGPQNVLTGSLNVLGNGLQITRIGDQITAHACGLAVHPSIVATGSKTVKVNGLPMARVGDMANCSSILATGSPNITCDDIVKTYRFPKLTDAYSAERVAEISSIAGASAPYDDEDSIGLQPNGARDNDQSTNGNPSTDNTPVSNDSAVANLKPNAKEGLNALIIAMNKAGIVDHKEQAMFLAQVDHESAGFMKLSELKYTPDNVWRQRGSTLSKFGITLEKVREDSKSKGLDYMYEYMYLDKYREAGFKIGNTSDGDGIKYKGRGYLQLTGKSQYSTSSKSLSLDLVGNPELAATPEVAAKIAIDFWFRNKCRTPAQQGNVEAVTRIINGGLNGLEDRKKKYANYLYDANLGRFDLPLKNIPAPSQKTTLPPKSDISIDPKTQLSPNFTLEMMTTKNVFPHQLRAQHNLSIQDIVYNLKTLCINVLEPLLAKYPNARVNSAFRGDTGSKSQHERGMAADIQWAGISNQEYLSRAKWIRDNLVYDKFLFEHGNTIWCHLSFDPNKTTQRKDVRTMYQQKFTSGLTLYYN